jgi:dsDNA-specific endonuclease/ATPase MutS2
MTTHEIVNKRYSEIQKLLHDKYAAEGRGIGEMVRSVESQLSPTLSWELRAIAHIRNKVVHEGLAEIPRYFEPLCKEAIAAMKGVKKKAATAPKKTAAKSAVKKSKAATKKTPVKKAKRVVR